MSFMDDFLLACSGVSGFYPVSIPYSARFDSARSCKLERTPGVAGNKKKFTLSVWTKPCLFGALNPIFSAYAGSGSSHTSIFVDSNDKLQVSHYTGTNYYYQSSAQFRDPSAWGHLVVAVDTTQAANADRVKVWWNGVAVAMTVGNAIPQNTDTYVNGTTLHQIGASQNSGYYSNRYLADLCFVDGSALTASDFGQFSSGNPNVWIPRAPAPIWGTNGVRLQFGNAAALGTDTSGQSNTWTSIGLASTDQMQDTPTNNWCALNPVGSARGQTFAEGNLKLTAVSGPSLFTGVGSFSLPATGKWYFEMSHSSAGIDFLVGLMAQGVDPSSSSGTPYRAYKTTGQKISGGIASLSAYGATWANGDVIGVAADMDAGTLTFYKNNVSQGQAFSDLSGTTWFPAATSFSVGGVLTMNFGANAFAYTPPSGFKALCSANLPDPAIIDCTKYMDAKTYTGTGAAQNITSFNFQPDLAWVKIRNGAADHGIFDSVRGATKELACNQAAAEATSATSLTAFLSNGFTVSTDNNLNQSGYNYISWCWRKLAAAGFDIVGYTGTGANRTVAHGLGAVPEFIIIKDRTTGATHWPVYHANANASPQNGGLYFCESNAFFAAAGFWNSTLPTSSLFNLGTNAGVNANGDNYIAYLFRSIPGFSMIGSYTANGQADGPFVYCGFRPRILIWKNVFLDSTDWGIHDAARSPANVVGKVLVPNTNAAEADWATNGFDMLSNGFKVRGKDGYYNRVGSTNNIIFAAFAAMPFKFANAA